MMSALKPLRVIISGGGTGGHIFPAISIANAIKERWSDAEILFVGAENRMEACSSCRIHHCRTSRSRFRPEKSAEKCFGSREIIEEYAKG